MANLQCACTVSHEKSAILEFYFQLRFWLYRCNRYVIKHQRATFHQNRTVRNWVMTSYWFSRWQPHRRKFLPVLDWVTLLYWERKSKSIWKPNVVEINTTWLRYNYFWFWKTNVCTFGILLPVLIWPYIRHRHFVLHSGVPNFIQ